MIRRGQQTPNLLPGFASCRSRMSFLTKSDRASLGFRVRSGWATAVLLSGPAKSPRLVNHRTIELSDPRLPETKQPYHASMGKIEPDASKVKQRTKSIQDATRKSATGLMQNYRKEGYKIHRAGLIVGSQINPDSIRNPHIRAHALEGRLFRTVLEEALSSNSLPCLIIIEREAYSKATSALDLSKEQLKGILSAFGRVAGGSWRADEKLASLAAWMALAIEE